MFLSMPFIKVSMRLSFPAFIWSLSEAAKEGSIATCEEETKRVERVREGWGRIGRLVGAGSDLNFGVFYDIFRKHDPLQTFVLPISHLHCVNSIGNILIDSSEDGRKKSRGSKVEKLHLKVR